MPQPQRIPLGLDGDVPEPAREAALPPHVPAAAHDAQPEPGRDVDHGEVAQASRLAEGLLREAEPVVRLDADHAGRDEGLEIVRERAAVEQVRVGGEHHLAPAPRSGAPER